jgi:DNA-binding LacI/PurR family transcriptional regulator
MRAMGEEAVRVLLERIHGGDAPAPPRAVLLAPELVVRESSGVAR